jgi:hypothetical protein
MNKVGKGDDDADAIEIEHAPDDGVIKGKSMSCKRATKESELTNFDIKNLYTLRAR